MGRDEAPSSGTESRLSVEPEEDGSDDVSSSRAVLTAVAAVAAVTGLGLEVRRAPGLWKGFTWNSAGSLTNIPRSRLLKENAFMPQI